MTVILLGLAIAALILLHCWRTPQPLATLCVYIRLFLGFIFLTAGFSKIAHQMGVIFDGIIGPVWLEDKLAPHGLALLGRFIACAQVIIGVCLLSSRLVTLGAIMLVPMLLGIWVVTVGMDYFQNTAYVVFVFLLMNGLLLLNDWHKLKFILSETTEELVSLRPVIRFRTADYLWVSGAFFILFALLVFHQWPAYGPRTVKIGLLIMLMSSFFYWRHGKKKQRLREDASIPAANQGT